MVNKERVQLLYDDLMNDDHRQAHGALERIEDGGHSYCCLGRAERVAEANGLSLIIEVSSIPDRMSFCDPGSEYRETGSMTQGTCEWYGFGDNNPLVSYIDAEGVKCWDTLAILNDGKLGVLPRSLPQMAQIIKENFLDD